MQTAQLKLTYSWGDILSPLELAINFPTDVNQLNFFINQLDANVENLAQATQAIEDENYPIQLNFVTLDTYPQHALEDVHKAIQATAEKFDWPSYHPKTM
jgi:hypothetical protein